MIICYKKKQTGQYERGLRTLQDMIMTAQNPHCLKPQYLGQKKQLKCNSCLAAIFRKKSRLKGSISCCLNLKEKRKDFIRKPLHEKKQ